jgi:hypothetical protein
MQDISRACVCAFRVNRYSDANTYSYTYAESNTGGSSLLCRAQHFTDGYWEHLESLGSANGFEPAIKCFAWSRHLICGAGRTLTVLQDRIFHYGLAV